MISPEDIRKQALQWWRPLLESYILNTSFFPKTIERIEKVKAGDVTQRYEALKDEIEQLYLYSKNKKGTGYLVITADKNFRRTGSHQLPDSILFESLDDYLDFTHKKKEWKLFLTNYEWIIQEIPSLKEWSYLNPLSLTDSITKWGDVIKVCHYFMTTPRPNLHLRQLPIDIHTKFIEEHAILIKSLLNFLIPNDIRYSEQKKIAERYYLKYDEPLIRIKILDEKISFLHNIRDISIPLSDFGQTNWPIENVLITENKMNFLALPPLISTIALWSGGGFNISYLKNIKWLHSKKILYWGDIDEHGYQILHQLRSYYSHTQSVLMDKQTFDSFLSLTTKGARNKSEYLHLLSEEEAYMYQFLKSSENNNRLEQEKIPQSYATIYLQQLID